MCWYNLPFIYRYRHEDAECRDITYLPFTGTDMRTLDAGI